ncbi:unnamed protein product [Trichogramma brassicae]|uniref:Uncharacterized protein n=1 Tax=Trichogramma brassicae TaxID=86971 RepID=A0A6H5J5L8_9HYME|nr:unnamed protein product [Trichogramma brassicae]
MNTAVQSSTRVSPAFLNYGRHPRPVKSLRREVETPAVEYWEIDETVWLDRISRLDAIRDLVKLHLDKAHARQARHYNRGRKDVRFTEGDLVMRRTHHLSVGADGFNKKLVHRVAARIECAYLRFSRRTQPSTYQATTPPIRPAPFTSAADRRDPRRAAFCVAPATSGPPVRSRTSCASAVLQRSGVSPLRTRRRPLCEASRVHDREIFSCPVSYLASRTLVGDEHPLVWRAVHRQSRPGRGEIDTGGVHGEATVTIDIIAIAICRANPISALFNSFFSL